MNQPPKALGQPGRALWRRIGRDNEIVGAEDLLVQLCHCEDRLHQVRAAIKKTAITGDSKVVSLLNVEVRLLGQYRSLWKVLGLSDDQEPARAVGRPPAFEAKR